MKKNPGTFLAVLVMTSGWLVMASNNQPLTIGDVKAFIRTRLTFYDMHEDHGCIFSQGRDAGVPHNAGN
ncbi:MAG TPA: hypothetical protein PKX93_08515, partial [bacterium]|nr:hypothetical protein [bacterium]